MINSKVNNYKIHSELGKGGMATVYLAYDEKFDSNVAFKLLNREYAHNENIRKRFLAEAKSMFRMSHPNIIKVTDLIDENDTVAFVMEYIEGETLKDFVDRKGKLSESDLKAVFSQMLDAVGYVHNQNLVHRDIKPSNFMIDIHGNVKLMDFGIAKNTDASSLEYTQTGTGMQMGTPLYMSPEQITETKSVTAQSDIYSLGVVLWQMIMGQKPYDNSTLSSFQLQTKIVNEPLAQTTTNYDTIIRKATEKEPNERFKDCQEFKNSFYNLEIVERDSDQTIIEAASTQIIENQVNYSSTSIDPSSDQTVVSNSTPVGTDSALLLISKMVNGSLKYGFINTKGEIVIEPVYDNALNFSQGLAGVQLNDKWGYIDKQANLVIQTLYDYTEGFCEGLARIQINKKWGYIDIHGNLVTQAIYDFADSFSKGLAKVQINKKWGWINSNGIFVIQPDYEWVGDFSKGLARVQFKKKMGVIDVHGNYVVQPQYDDLSDFAEGLAAAKSNGKWGFIDLSGNQIIQPIFDDAYSFSNGLARIEVNGKWGFIDLYGKAMVQPQFDDAKSFSEGLAAVRINEKWGVINSSGNLIIQPQFDFIDDYSEGVARMGVNLKYGVIDIHGNLIVQPIYDNIYRFSKGCAQVKMNDKYGVINTTGNWIIQPMFTSIAELETAENDTFWRVYNANKYGYIDHELNEICPTIYELEVDNEDD
jgi:serine/threonine protein kinase